MNVRFFFSLLFLSIVFFIFLSSYIHFFFVICLRFNEFPLLGIGLNVETPFFKRGSM